MAIVGYGFVRFGCDLRAIYRSGVLGDLLNKNSPKNEYAGSQSENLRAIQTALLLYHDSNDQFPQADGWMDAILPYLQTNDLKAGEAHKKLLNPSVSDLGEHESGYALNDAIAGKYKDDIKTGSKTILVFESKDHKWNAHGSPETLSKGKNAHSVSIDGTLTP
jgi:hypothetical protein